MKVLFQYDKEADVWCLLNKGRSSLNSPEPTKQYIKLVEKFGEHPTNEEVSNFIDQYEIDNNLNTQELIEKYQKDWDDVADEFQHRSEKIFGISLPKDVVGYLTVNSRCPYNIKENNFFVSMLSSKSHVNTVMHELWHFYTWYSLGVEQEEILGKQKYNELKEALTVLLNVECKDLMPEGSSDSGYTHHQELRQQMLEFWKSDKDIKRLWNHFTK